MMLTALGGEVEQVARHLRSGSGPQHLVLVAVTGCGQESDRTLAFEAGFDHHLVKPANRDDIQRVIEGKKCYR